ncbi:DsbE family thiol:disulfide interchange protein [Ottowia testudinis]|uniref:DsbE family thiol:disulfide interchange protein n=1 Tax=Ottowia testudinis TaxID=2816950 RepID=A0A975H3M4_9BURK|nr:DsbE family thiol:disulfide interchange protein [Ottowia testudinis]QTD45979.1 DsbE family thiol:disulfide interchange protein [Ottowia testudinis]
MSAAPASPRAGAASAPGRRRWGLWAAFAAVAALLALLAVGMTRDPRELPSALIGQPWPARALSLLEVPERAMGPADWRGKARVINLWASWCTTCLQEHPELTRLLAQLKSQGHEDQLIGLNYKDPRADALGWLRRHGNPFFASIQDADGRLGIDLGVYGAPETFVIDAQGVVRFKHVGALTEEVIRTRIVPLLEAGR